MVEIESWSRCPAFFTPGMDHMMSQDVWKVHMLCMCTRLVRSGQDKTPHPEIVSASDKLTTINRSYTAVMRALFPSCCYFFLCHICCMLLNIHIHYVPVRHMIRRCGSERSDSVALSWKANDEEEQEIWAQAGGAFAKQVSLNLSHHLVPRFWINNHIYV